MWNFWKHKTWNNKKIAFVAILIATSVALILVFNSILPVASLPSFKLLAGGLPVKITGYIFGPLVGAITGIVADLISFAFRPTFIHWWYTLAFACAGAIPGFVGWLMFRRWKNKESMPPKDKVQYNYINMAVAIAMLTLVIVAITVFVILQGDKVFSDPRVLIHNKYLFLSIAIAGSSTMLLAIIVFRFVLKPETFNSLIPIIVFSSLLELVATPLITLGDIAVWGQTGTSSFVTLLTAHLLMSPVKIWGNLLVVYFTYRIVGPLIFNKTDNSWKDEK